MTKDVFIKEVRDAEAMLYHISKSILKNDSDCGDAVQKIKVAADLYRKLPFCKIPEELKKLRLYKIYML